jgi:hypothetical protein
MSIEIKPAKASRRNFAYTVRSLVVSCSVRKGVALLAKTPSALPAHAQSLHQTFLIIIFSAEKWPLL